MTDQTILLSSEELTDKIDLKNYPNFRFTFQLGSSLTMKDGQENYDKATEIVTNMTYVNEAVYKSGNYTKKFLNDTKGINDPRGYGFIHSGKPYKNSKGLLEYNIDLNGTLL